MRTTIRDFWAEMRKAAEAARVAPAWKQAGINITPRHFETWRPEVLA